MESIKIIALCIGSAIVYGILHDQVTARVCVEYFTIGHPPVFGTDSPTLLAFGWGVIATWWVGLILGIPAALASRVGRWPKYTAARLLRPIAVLLVVMAVASLLAGITGYLLANAGGIKLVGPLRMEVPPEKHVPFLADLWAHITAYLVGFLGGLVLCLWVVIRRWQMAQSGFNHVLDELARMLDGLNYNVFLKQYRMPSSPGATLQRCIVEALGPVAEIGGSISSTGPEVLEEIEKALRYEGDAGYGPRRENLRSKDFEELASKVLAHFEKALSEATVIESFWLKEGHPGYPVYWDFAYRITGPKETEIFIGSSSD